MADVSKIQGPSGPPNQPKKESSADPSKFKDELHKRVKEVGAVDPDEQKKRRQRGEPEETPIEGAIPQPTPPQNVTPFSHDTKQAKSIEISPTAASTPSTGSPNPPHLLDPRHAPS